LVIDKLRYKLYLVNKGNTEISLPIELGFNPIDDKRKEGDGCTPEGIYKITEKRDVGKTKFYRGFMLNYPNELDKKEFALMRTSGDIPQDASIGGQIMIHGHGSGNDPNNGGSNWTLGCVALSNEDVDEIFEYIGVGTSVVIVKTCSVL
jgi:murein L,D-transpeptidase YafK